MTTDESFTDGASGKQGDTGYRISCWVTEAVGEANPVHVKADVILKRGLPLNATRVKPPRKTSRN